MTPEEWRQAGLATGQFAGREAVQFGAIKAGITDLSNRRANNKNILSFKAHRL
jgi:hypothetical protein